MQPTGEESSQGQHCIAFISLPPLQTSMPGIFLLLLFCGRRMNLGHPYHSCCTESDGEEGFVPSWRVAEHVPSSSCAGCQPQSQTGTRSAKPQVYCFGVKRKAIPHLGMTGNNQTPKGEDI